MLEPATSVGFGDLLLKDGAVWPTSSRLEEDTASTNLLGEHGNSSG
ncbi:MAG: hypothetical protein JSV20_02045 [Candidatus Bathyarchaeota archaeon]|nr:MAG: hypothetical protein JSV20_02045 [Candidatus Bathyarchaeota archaeon]